MSTIDPITESVDITLMSGSDAVMRFIAIVDLDAKAAMSLLGDLSYASGQFDRVVAELIAVGVLHPCPFGCGGLDTEPRNDCDCLDPPEDLDDEPFDSRDFDDQGYFDNYGYSDPDNEPTPAQALARARTYFRDPVMAAEAARDTPGDFV